MGVFTNIRGRNDAVAVSDLGPVSDPAASGAKAADGAGIKDAEAGGDYGFQSGNSSQLSLEERNEKEVIEHGDKITEDAQLGVQKAEAAALVWSKKAVLLTYAWIWVCFFMLALQQSILSNVMYLAYSGFQAASQVSTANILANVIGGVLKLPIAKVLNIWGRAEGFSIFVGVYLLGMIILASCNGPNSYAAGYTLYWIGYDAIYFIMDVFIADTSGLRNRAFAFAFASTPFICTAFTGPLAAQSFLRMTSWRWAIGAFCIIMFFVFSPLAVIFKFYQLKAEKQGLFTRKPSGRTTLQSVVHYFHEFDVIGALILIAGWVLLLLPFSLKTNGKSQYKDASFIALVVIGFVLLFVFAAWERFFARTHFIRWELFRKRTVLGACLTAGVLYYSFYAWDTYYYYFVMVVYDLNISKTGYMSQIYNVGSCFWGAVFGIYVRQTKHFKYACLFFGVPLMILGSGLMIHFRGQHSNIGYIVMCQIFIAFAGGTIVISMSMAMMASADRDGVPLLLALIYLCNSLGGAIGTAVTGAIYNNVFVKGLESKLPSHNETLAATISAGGYLTQLTYPVGTPERDAINYAWGYSQKYNCISSTAMLSVALIGVGIWKNYNVDKRQNKGTLL